MRGWSTCYWPPRRSYLQRTRLAGTPSGPLLLGALAGIWIIWIAYYTTGYTSYIVGALSFTFVLAASVLVYLRLRSGQAPSSPTRIDAFPNPKPPHSCRPWPP